MQRKRLLIGLIVSLFAMFLFACGGGGGGGGHGHGRVFGNHIISSAGGDGVIAGGNGIIQISAQNWGSILSGGGFTVPDVTMPAGATIITENTTWTSGQNGAIPSGFKLAAGATLTVPDTTSMDIKVDGPVVIAGKIVRGPDSGTGDPVAVDIGANGPIVVLAEIDMSGPESVSGDGIDGGIIVLDNHLTVDNTFGIFIKGNLLVNGGDTLDAASSGGEGGIIEIEGGDNEDINIDASLEANGGAGAGSGDGADGGIVLIVNNTNDGTNADDGNILLCDVKRISASGGEGEAVGGEGGILAMSSDIEGVEISAPIDITGGDATDPAGSAGGGGIVDIGANANSVNPVEDADLIIRADISANGGSGALGGDGGIVAIRTWEGNIYVDAYVALFGGVGLSTTAGKGGGEGGILDARIEQKNADDFFSMGIRRVSVDGGDGGDAGGSAGIIGQDNETLGFIVVGPRAISASGGEGITTNGDPGMVMYNGNVLPVGRFPSFANLP